MKLVAMVGVAAAVAFFSSQAAFAQSAARIACLPTFGTSSAPYWIDCQQAGIDCSCKEGFVAFDPLVIQTQGSSAGGGPRNATDG